MNKVEERREAAVAGGVEGGRGEGREEGARKVTWREPGRLVRARLVGRTCVSP